MNMKRFFKFAALLLVAVTLCGAVEAKAPKAKQLIGEWKVDDASASQMIGVGDAIPEDVTNLDVQAVLKFQRGDKAEFVADVVFEMDVDEGVSMVMEFGATFFCKWSYIDESLKISIESYDFSFNNIKLNPSDPEFEQMLPMILPALESSLEEEMAESIRSYDIVKDGTVEFVSKGVMTVTEDDATMTLTRN